MSQPSLTAPASAGSSARTLGTLCQVRRRSSARNASTVRRRRIAGSVFRAAPRCGTPSGPAAFVRAAASSGRLPSVLPVAKSRRTRLGIVNQICPSRGRKIMRSNEPAPNPSIERTSKGRFAPLARRSMSNVRCLPTWGWKCHKSRSGLTIWKSSRRCMRRSQHFKGTPLACFNTPC